MAKGMNAWIASLRPWAPCLRLPCAWLTGLAGLAGRAGRGRRGPKRGEHREGKGSKGQKGKNGGADGALSTVLCLRPGL